MTVDIICPLYKGRHYIEELHKSLLMQKEIDLNCIRYVLTESGDGSENVLKKLDRCTYKVISHDDFSHSLIREEEAFKSDADIVVFISQDVRIVRDDWLYNLVKPIIEGKSEASYSRQLCDNYTIERYTREKNYPAVSVVKSKPDIEKMGFRTFFFSDASSAISRKVFVQLGGYDGKDFPSNEDTYIGWKLIMNGYRIKYCADSEVIHSHHFTLKEQYKRYFATGEFFGMEPELQKLKAESAGAGLAKYILERAFQEHNVNAILRFLPDMAVRYLGIKKGERDAKYN